MERHLLTLICAFASLVTCAQVVNGSFEDNGQPSLTGWEWTCGTPIVMAGGAPGAGSFAATKEPSQTQGCFPSHLYQRLPNAVDGDLVTLSAWVRCDAGLICLGANFGLGRVNGGMFSFEENTGTMDTSWTFLSITDTIELSPGDTAMIALNSGFIGGPIQPTSGWFDGVELSLAQSVGDAGLVQVGHFPDPSSSVLHVSAGTAVVQQVEVLNMQGQVVMRAVGKGSGTQHIDVQVLDSGSYVAKVRTSRGLGAFRFIKE